METKQLISKPPCSSLELAISPKGNCIVSDNEWAQCNPNFDFQKSICSFELFPGERKVTTKKQTKGRIPSLDSWELGEKSKFQADTQVIYKH